MDGSGDGEGGRLGFADLRAESCGCDPLWSVMGLPLALWAVRALLLALPRRVVVVAAEGRVAALAGRAGVRVVDGAGAEGLFVERLERGLGGPDLVARASAPFCSASTAAAALGSPGVELADFQSSAIERLRVTGEGERELADAVARGLVAGHAAVAGASRLRLPLVPVRAVVTDVDGTLTDGRIWFDGHTPAGRGGVDSSHDAGGGEPGRAFDTRDGMGMKLLREGGIGLGVLSSTLRGESSRQRMRMMGVEHVDVGPGHKAERFLELCRAMGVAAGEVVYFGDDINDAPAMDLAGLVACPADAHPAVRNRADLVLERCGGRGAFRELADLLTGGGVVDSGGGVPGGGGSGV